MGLRFNYLEGRKMANEPYIAEQRLYLNADESEIVPEDSPDAAFLLAGEGCEVPPEAVERYGLRPKPPQPRRRKAPEPELEPEPEVEAVAEQPEPEGPAAEPEEEKPAIYPPEVRRSRRRARKG